VDGLTPAVAVLMLYVAVKLVAGVVTSAYVVAMIVLALGSLAAFLAGAPPPVVLLAAGVVGILLFR
jgi:chromate transport protein ChrA